MSATNFQKAVHSLLTKEPYFAHFVLNSVILWDCYKVKTGAACVIGGTPTLIFNTKFVSEQTVPQLAGLVKHEIFHLALKHCTNYDIKKPNERHNLNIAMDCAINQYIDVLPDGCITVEGLSKAIETDLLPFQTTDYYYSFIQEFVKNNPDKCDSVGSTTDDHDLDIPDADTGELARAAINGVSKKAIGLAAGNAPGAILKGLEGWGESKLPWRQLLKNFVFREVSRKTLMTHKKINRRFPLPIPGKKKLRTLTLGVCLDSSGSVSDSDYAAFLTEVRTIAGQIDKTYLIHADCVVQHVEEVTSKTDVRMERNGNGGTAYQPAIDKCVELGCDVIIYFGDFDTSDLPKDPKRPFLWVGVGSQNPPADFGKVLRLT